MKLIFFTLFTILFTSCNSKSQNVNKGKDKLDRSEIVESWAMCATSSNVMMNQMNTGATITFMNYGAGFVIKNTLITESFNWAYDKDSLKIINEKNSNSTFTDTFYYASFYKEKGMLNLTIRHNDKFFYLSRFVQDK